MLWVYYSQIFVPYFIYLSLIKKTSLGTVINTCIVLFSGQVCPILFYISVTNMCPVFLIFVQCFLYIYQLINREWNFYSYWLVNIGLTFFSFVWLSSLPHSFNIEYIRNRLGLPNFRFIFSEKVLT